MVSVELTGCFHFLAGGKTSVAQIKSLQEDFHTLGGFLIAYSDGRPEILFSRQCDFVAPAAYLAYSTARVSRTTVTRI